MVTESSNKVPDMGKMLLWSDSPRWEYSSAPLTYSDGVPLPPAAAGAGGHAIYLNDQQVSLFQSSNLQYCVELILGCAPQEDV